VIGKDIKDLQVLSSSTTSHQHSKSKSTKIMSLDNHVLEQAPPPPQQQKVN
jgi:hypothetical protein